MVLCRMVQGLLLAFLVIGIFSLSPTAEASLYLDANIVGYWNMNESNSTHLIDYSPQRHNGVFTGATRATGYVGGGVFFDGNDTITVSPGPVFDLNAINGATTTVWIYWDGNTMGGNEAVIVEKAFSNFDIALQFGDVFCRLRNADNSFITTSTVGDLNANAWTHLACVYDRVAQELVLYINGVEATSVTANLVSFRAGAQSNYGIGNRPAAINTYYHLTGTMDELRLYNRSLSAQEVLDDMGVGDDGHPVVTLIRPGLGDYNRGNVTLNFTVSDLDANGNADSNMTASLYLSTSPGALTNLLVRDLNLMNTAVCGDQNFRSANTCVYTFDSSSYADGNYYLDVNVVDRLGGQLRDFNFFSGGAFVIDNTPYVSSELVLDYNQTGIISSTASTDRFLGTLQTLTATAALASGSNRTPIRDVNIYVTDINAADTTPRLATNSNGVFFADYTTGQFDLNFVDRNVLFRIKDAAGNQVDFNGARTIILYSTAYPTISGIETTTSTSMQSIANFAGIDDFTIDTNVGKIVFGDDINLATISLATQLLSLSSSIVFSKNAGDVNISVRTSDISSFDVESVLSFYGLSYSSTPRLLVDGTTECTECTLSYSGGTLTATVPDFSDYVTAAPIVTATTTAATPVGSIYGIGNYGVTVISSPPIEQTASYTPVPLGGTVILSFQSTSRHAIRTVELTPAAAITRAAVRVEKLVHPPSVTLPVPVYQYLEITPALSDDAAIALAKIQFDVPLEWVQTNQSGPEEIALHHFDGTTWRALPTHLISSDEKTIRFESATTHFSPFAIGLIDDTLVPVEEFPLPVLVPSGQAGNNPDSDSPTPLPSASPGDEYLSENGSPVQVDWVLLGVAAALILVVGYFAFVGLWPRHPPGTIPLRGE